MIITRTPVRISLLGGSSDFPDFFLKYRGLVLGGAIDRYVFVSLRTLPPFHEHKSRVVYSLVENVGRLEDIKHPVVRGCLTNRGLIGDNEPGLEIFHQSDVPGMSGLGTSSAFTVGLLHALSAREGRWQPAMDLAREAMHVEQEVLGERVGCQDQLFAALGGLRLIEFTTRGHFLADPLLLSADRQTELENHLILFFTRLPRVSSEVVKTYKSDTATILALVRMAEQGAEVVRKGDWERLGWLIDQSWRAKARLSPMVSSDFISELYARARLAGAWGGKLTGAGSGGCLLLVVPEEKRERVKRALSGLVHIPFRFAPRGSEVLFAQGD